MTVGIAACATVFVACGGESGTAPAGSAALNVAITDSPFPFDSVARADIYVVRIDGKLADTDSTEAESGKDNDSNRNENPASDWVTLATPNQSFNLLDLQGGKTTNLSQKTLPTGTYRGFRLILDTDKSSVTLKNGTVLTSANGGIKFPSAGRSGIKIKLEQPISLVSNGTQMVIDFDLGKSFVMRGNSIGKNGLLFKPVIRAVARDITGGISGTVHAGTATGAVVRGASVEILKSGSALTDTVSADVIATTKSDSTGAYSVQFLMPASYAVRATPPSGSTNSPALVPSVTVASGKTTTGTDIVLP
ncbi:MAG TPA: DUF4382 domain-containing protein [Candidatus Elarobacter sp.]|nr:DUF4382 domain-containing protein [Candidatus Elarobacter sp.]